MGGHQTNLAECKWDQARTAKRLMVLLFFAFYLYAAARLPMQSCPDEAMRSDIPRWIIEHNALPIGDEPELTGSIWAFSYGFLPYLPSIIAAGFMKLSLVFRSSWALHQLAMRMVSVLSGAMSVLLAIKIAPYLFKNKIIHFLFPLLFGLIPQICFLSGYLNNDIFTLMGSMGILYFLLSGRDEQWPVSRCVGLAASMSACILSYYYSYGWVLVGAIYCVLAVWKDERIEKKWGFILKRGCLVAGIVFLLTGWHFIRNLIIYDGDLLGYAAMGRCVDAIEATGREVFRGLSLFQEGKSLAYMLFDMGWLKTSAKSFICILGYMSISLPDALYSCYGLMLATGSVIGLVSSMRGKALPCRLTGCLLATAIIPVLLSMYTSYVRDFQAQGRYFITALPAVAVFTALGYDQLHTFLKERTPVAYAVTAMVILCWISLCAISIVKYLLPLCA